MCLREDSSTTVLCGVVTGGDRFCRTRDDHPAFYTRVSEYREWIRKRIDGTNEKIRPTAFMIIRLNILYNIAETCEADFTCYVKECSSENGPHALMEGLKVTPTTPVFAAVRLIYEQQLEDMKCPYVSIDRDIGLGQKRYCCPDMVTDETTEYPGEDLDLRYSAILPTWAVVRYGPPGTGTP